jgi:hypothetical protein
MRMTLLCGVLCLLVACGGEEVAGVATDVPATVTGNVVSVEPAEGDVVSFVLEEDGTRYELRIADDVDYGFDLGHLREHMDLADPVRVSTEMRGDGAYALLIEDV